MKILEKESMPQLLHFIKNGNSKLLLEMHRYETLLDSEDGEDVLKGIIFFLIFHENIINFFDMKQELINQKVKFLVDEGILI